MNRITLLTAIIPALAALLTLAAGILAIGENRRMAFAENKTATTRRIPPMDRDAPKHTETATFALG